MKKENAPQGIVFYKTIHNAFYYINKRREHIWIEKPHLINSDKTIKSIIRNTAKPYTEVGYAIMETKLWLNNPDIAETCWMSFKTFDKDNVVIF